MTGMRDSNLKAISKDFTTIYKIKRSDFIRIISENNENYQKFCTLKD